MTNGKPLLPAWHWWLTPALISLILILIFVDPFIGDWDALEYTISALRGMPSSMALGRSLFIFGNHALYYVAHAIFNLSPQQAYLLFKYAVVAQGPLAVIACWILTRDLTQSIYAATIAALLVTFSPVFVMYSGQVMTDVPALLLLTVALIIHLRGLRLGKVWLVLVGAALLGAGVNLRETVGFYAPWLAFAPFICGSQTRRKAFLLAALSCLIFLILALAPFGYFFFFDPKYQAAWYGWRESMRAESAIHPISIKTIWPWLAFFLASSPLVLLSLPFAAIREWRQRRLSPMLLLAAVGLFANLLLLLNYSTAIGWRYLSTGLPALAPLTSNYLVEFLTQRLGSARRAFILSAAAIGLIAICFGAFLWPMRSATIKVRTGAKEYDRTLMTIPRDAVIISGAQTVAVKYWRGIGAGEWDVIGPGSGWPGSQLGSVIESYLKSGRRVFLDVDQRWWQPCGWHIAEIRDLAGIESRFHFHRIAPTVFEIRSLEDTSAIDQPDLARLLPENRPEERKKCFSAE